MVTAPGAFGGEFGSVTLDDLADCKQHVAWREDHFNGKPSKRPYNPKTGRLAKNNDPTTWATSREARACADNLLRDGAKGGIGIQLGAIAGRNGLCLGGIDLDTCRNSSTKEIEIWAQQIIDRLASYTEVSPSGEGAKIFFLYAAGDLPTLLGELGDRLGRSFKVGTGQHPAAIECFFGKRYFTITGLPLSGPHELRLVSVADMLWVLREAGPRFSGIKPGTRKGHDTSGSGVLFRLARKIKQQGGTTEDFGAAIGKYPEAARHVEEQDDRQRALDRAWNRASSGRTAPGSLNFVCAADVNPEPIAWLWSGRIARGKLTMISGDPGIGKSQIASDVAARLSNGALWPDGGWAPIGSTIILSAEDAMDDTMVPRLMAAGANRSRIYILKSVTGEGDVARSFNLQADLDALGKKIATLRDVALVVIDPITSYMGKVDSHRMTDVRAVLEPVAVWAEGLNVAVLAVTHPPKAAQAKAIHGLTGSLAFAAVSRLVFLAIAEPETDRILFLSMKNNIGPKTKGLAYRVVSREVKSGIASSYVEWDREAVTMTADEAIRADRHPERTSAMHEAEDFLRRYLADGQRPAVDVDTAAKKTGISERTLSRAKANLKIKSRKSDFDEGWLWELP